MRDWLNEWTGYLLLATVISIAIICAAVLGVTNMQNSRLNDQARLQNGGAVVCENTRVQIVQYQK